MKPAVDVGTTEGGSSRARRDGLPSDLNDTATLRVRTLSTPCLQLPIYQVVRRRRNPDKTLSKMSQGFDRCHQWTSDYLEKNQGKGRRSGRGKSIHKDHSEGFSC